MNIINNTKGMFAGNLGDIQNNWVGRLSFLYGQQSTTAKESWRLTEHFVNRVYWLYLVAGNHDVWSGDGDPLDFIMRDHKGVYEKWGARLNLRFPNGKEVITKEFLYKDVRMFFNNSSYQSKVELLERFIITKGLKISFK